ncbi:LysM peptidoglycan-binding domain-containing protein [Streptococcus thermophilus]|uniref:LysM peptidoglycan-binding domain-containing protein n=1 Tax=Streptococcus thermophilus TaxID=1308 RepID=UPI00156D75E9|nr:LysM peptidoglycan-binding domain-containing protein [Streptococcus thermophilus]NVH35203.1 GA module-containing protein [Streptococcus thermophilus]QKM72241.1 LysM peptidoglycan-binding domain-containing protein [Streptococcus thermophilus]
MRKIIGKKNKVHYVEEITRFKMVKSHKGWLVIRTSMFALGLGLNIPATTAHASQLDGQWTARTVQEIKADFDKSGTSQSYKIQWGDTLSAISAAISVSQDRLAQINSIENKDLIFAGNTIQIDGHGSDATITIKDQDGKADKVYNVDPNKPVVNTEKTNELQSENANDTGSAKATVAANESAQATVANGNTTVNDSSSAAGSSNNGASSGINGSTSTNVKPSNPTNPNGNNGSDNSNTNPSPNKTELEKLKETLASQNAKLSDLQSKSTAAQSDLDAAKSALTAAQNKDISQFESAVQAQTEKVNAIKTDLDNIKTEIDSNTKNIESLNEVIASLKANIASSDTNIVTAQNGLATAQSTNDAKQLAYNQIIATISDQYPSINVETADGLAALETSNPDLKASFDAAKSDKDDSELELENAKTAVSDAAVAKPNMQASLTENENKIVALTEQINTDTAKVSPLESKLTTETATLSDLQQQLDNAKNSNVEQLQADVNAKQSVVDNLTKEIESAKADIDKTTKAIADIELKVAREDATNKAELDLKTSKNNAVSEINGLKFLSDKQSFTDKVNDAGSIDAVASILHEAEAKDKDAAEQLKNSKVKAIDDVNALSGLNDSEKASFAYKINASTTLNGVASVVSDAKAVATYKESAKTTVSNLAKLSDESKNGYTNRIKSATSTTNVDAIVAEAKAESQLIQDKESAVSEINGLKFLSDKQSFTDKVNDAGSIDAVASILHEAEAKDKDAAEQLKNDTSAKVNVFQTILRLFKQLLPRL